MVKKIVQYHHHIILSLLAIGLVSFTSVSFFPKNSQAEIATQQDWLGIFVVGAPVDSTRIIGTDGLMDWKYTGNTDLAGGQAPGNCWSSQTGNPPRGSAKPWLVGKCPFNPPIQSGAYEFRLYANDIQSAEAWLAQSKTVWVPFNVDPNTGCDRISNPWKGNITITIPYLVGINNYNVYKKTGANAWTGPTPVSLVESPSGPAVYSESNLTRDETYSYRVEAVSKRPLDPDTNPSATKDATNASSTTPFSFIACSVPWLKTSGGDVHSNK